MAGIERKNFDSPDETRRPDKSTVAVVKVAGVSAGRKVLQPGWALVRVHQANRRHRGLRASPPRCRRVGSVARAASRRLGGRTGT